MRKLSLILLLTFFCLNLYAGEYRRLGRSYRSLAMGGTGITTANDSFALSYNPAAMANIDEFLWEWTMIQLEYSDDFLKIQQDLVANGGLNFDTPAAAATFINSHVGENPQLRAYLSSMFLNSTLLKPFFGSGRVNGGILILNVSDRGWTFGISAVDEITYDFDINNPTIPEIDAFERWDSMYQAGISVPFGLGSLVLGVTGRQVRRRQLEFTYAVTSGDDFPSFPGDARDDTTIAYDVGILYRMPNALRIVIGVVVQNIGGLKFENEEGMNEPQETSVGISMTHDIKIIRLTLAADYRDVTFQQGSDTDTSQNRRIHLGVELGIFPFDKTHSFITLRGGYNQSYPTYGAEINLFSYGVLGFTRYTEETGETAGQKSSSRTILYFSSSF